MNALPARNLKGEFVNNIAIQNAFVDLATMFVMGVAGRYSPKSIGAVDVGVNQGNTAVLKNGYYEVNGYKFSKYYYEKLWNAGRKAPTFRVSQILDNSLTKVADKYKGFYRYEYDGWELIYNPTTKEVWHLQPMR